MFRTTMPEPKTPAPFKPSGMIEFEFTDITDAREAAGRPEAVVAIEKLMPGFWEDQRRPPAATDRALSGQGIDDPASGVPSGDARGHDPSAESSGGACGIDALAAG
jgi:hypothetical protein